LLASLESSFENFLILNVYYQLFGQELEVEERSAKIRARSNSKFST
jgi:hypothetical protein